MTIAERINLHKCGYSKEEIAQLIEAEKNTSEPETNSEQAVEKVVETVQNEQPQNIEILNAIKDLTKAIQVQNLQNAQQKASEVVTAQDVLTGALKNL